MSYDTWNINARLKYYIHDIGIGSTQRQCSKKKILNNNISLYETNFRSDLKFIF